MNKTVFALALSVLTLTNVSAGQRATNENTGNKLVMKIDTLEVWADEYDYMYHKNIDQQEKKSLPDDYFMMFANYKMKVLAAREAGIDTTATFLNEIERYRRELAAPYLRSKEVDDSLVRDAYSHLLTDVKLKHIVVAPRSPKEQGTDFGALADSLVGVLRHGADFSDIARRYSADRNAGFNGGLLGWIAPGIYPASFEALAHNTPVGEVSDAMHSRIGYHIVKPLERRPSKGYVKVRHILLDTRNADAAAKEAKRLLADSLVNVARTGADFADLASRYSEEPGAAQRGGDLPQFTAGMMVPAFEEAAFALNEGEVSDVVETQFGFHIIKMEKCIGIPPFNEVEQSLREAMMHGDLADMAVERTHRKFASQWNVAPVAKTTQKVEKIFKKHNGLNSASRKELSKLKDACGKVDGRKVAMAEALQLLPAGDLDTESATKAYASAVEAALHIAVDNRILATLPDREPEYRHLLNEYRDGLLLYEISNRRVWGKANTDTTGLEDCFKRHIDQLKWDTPHYKGYIVAAQSDSLADEAVKFLKKTDAPSSRLGNELMKRFGKRVKLERIVAGKGDNAVLDHVAFGAPHPGAVGRWTSFRPFAGRIIDQPEEASDVKGQVSLIYQQELENEWLDELRRKYPVRIYQPI